MVFFMQWLDLETLTAEASLLRRKPLHRACEGDTVAREEMAAAFGTFLHFTVHVVEASVGDVAIPAPAANQV